MNPHKGEVVFDAGGQAYTMRFSIDAICALEEETGKGVVLLSEELSDPAKLRMSLVRQVVWAGLRDAHPELTVKQAGELIASSGGLSNMVERIGRAFQLAFPVDEKTGDRPQKPGQDGTGPASGKPGAR